LLSDTVLTLSFLATVHNREALFHSVQNSSLTVPAARTTFFSRYSFIATAFRRIAHALLDFYHLLLLHHPLLRWLHPHPPNSHL
jgi:hypothetical protein